MTRDQNSSQYVALVQVWRAVCIKNTKCNRVIERNNFGPRRRGRGLVGVTNVGVVTHCTILQQYVSPRFLLPVTGHPVSCVRVTVSVDLSLCH